MSLGYFFMEVCYERLLKSQSKQFYRIFCMVDVDASVMRFTNNKDNKIMERILCQKFIRLQISL